MDLTNIYFLNEVGSKANQEDSIWPSPGSATLHDKVFIVCDGVGGSEKGEVASRIISETVGGAILKLGNREMSAFLINSLLDQAQEILLQYAHRSGFSTDMATTLTLLVLSEKSVFISWCGDSRIYHIRNGQILYKTSDHSLVNSLIRNGEITEMEAITHPRKNIILKAIKADKSLIEADHHLIEDVQMGDYFLLCTDGLLENITDQDLVFLLKQNDKGSIDLEKGFRQFCENKTRDNYSMYLLRVHLNPKPSGYKKKIIALSLFLALLILASIILLTVYLNKKNSVKKNTPIKSTDTTTETITKQTASDSLLNSEKLNLTPEKEITTSDNTKQGDLSHKDSLFKKKAGIVERKAPVIIMIDNSDDTIPEMKRQNGKREVIESKDTSKIN